MPRMINVQQRRELARTIDTTFDFVEDLADAKFWGAVTIKFEDGQVVHIRKEENIKPETLSQKERSTNERTASN